MNTLYMSYNEKYDTNVNMLAAEDVNKKDYICVYNRMKNHTPLVEIAIFPEEHDALIHLIDNRHVQEKLKVDREIIDYYHEEYWKNFVEMRGKYTCQIYSILWFKELYFKWQDAYYNDELYKFYAFLDERERDCKKCYYEY